MRDERKNSHPEKTKESSSHLTSPLPVPAVLRVVRRRGDIWEGRVEDRSDWGSIVPGSTGSGRLYCPHQGCSDSLRSAGGEADSYCWRVSQKGITVSQGQCLTRTQCHFPLRVSFLSFFFFFFFLSNGLQRGNTGAATACDTVTNFWLPVSDLTGPCSLPLITAFIIHIYYRTQTHELARSFLSLSSSLPQCPCVSLRLGDDTEPQRWPKVEIWFS